MMSNAVKWDGFPVFGRDRDAWHLLNCDDSEHPVPMWWDWRIEAWKSDPEDIFSVGAPSVAEIGYSYLAGTATPADLKEAIAEAVAAERERIAEYLSSLWTSSTLEGDEVSVTVKIKVPFLMNEKTNSTILRAIRSAAK